FVPTWGSGAISWTASAGDYTVTTGVRVATLNACFTDGGGGNRDGTLEAVVLQTPSSSLTGTKIMAITDGTSNTMVIGELAGRRCTAAASSSRRPPSSRGPGGATPSAARTGSSAPCSTVPIPPAAARASSTATTCAGKVSTASTPAARTSSWPTAPCAPSAR